jgi:hypothetical protein
MLRTLAIAAAVVCFSGGAAAQELSLSAFDTPLACQAQPDLTLLNNGERITMRSIVAQTRTAARAMGWGGVSQYAVLPGRAAIYRLPSPTPTFLVSAPSNIQPQGLITLARFEPRPNGTREVVIGGGYMSYSSGIHPDRVVPVTMRQAASQRGAAPNTIIYEVTPDAPLSPGEYAMIIAVGGGQASMGMGSPIVGTYYDFGVD